ncbi:MAG: 3'-5' exonuclease [Rubrivivax sp.]|nr:3'-5' exonuclease [Rubrivivax sp.]
MRAESERWVVLDVETTGLDARRDALLAIAAVALYRDGDRLRLLPADSFDVRLAHHAAAIDRGNILLHGIGVGEQRTGVDPAEALRDFHTWAAGAPRLGFHVSFDRQVIERAQRSVPGSRASAAAWIDIAVLARAVGPRVQGRALDDWLDHYGIPCLRRHDAAADTLATAELLLRLWPLLRKSGARDAAALARLERDAAWLGVR